MASGPPCRRLRAGCAIAKQQLVAGLSSRELTPTMGGRIQQMDTLRVDMLGDHEDFVQPVIYRSFGMLDRGQRRSRSRQRRSKSTNGNSCMHSGSGIRPLVPRRNEPNPPPVSHLRGMEHGARSLPAEAAERLR